MDNRKQAGAVFVGRQRELGTLLEGLDSAVAGRGRLILVGGEPGIGKSRLADELAGTPVIEGSASSGAGAGRMPARRPTGPGSRRSEPCFAR